jgi:hypothetical protein
VVLFLFLILFFSFFRPAFAQIPLFYQLLEAYHPASLSYSDTTSVSSLAAILPLTQILSAKPTITTPVTTQVLGAAIGGDGKIVTIAILGDSMINTLTPNLPQLQTALQKYYPNIKFNLLNYGAGGSNIDDGLNRLLHDHEYLGKKIPSLISQKPDIIVVESFAYNNFGNSELGINRQWLGLGAIVHNIKTLLPETKIVLAATIAPNSIVFGNGIKDTHFTALEKLEKSKTIRLYLQNLINFATSEGYPLADAYNPSLFDDEGYLPFINSGDHLHPSGPGGEFFCDTVAKTIFDHKLL